MRTNIRFLNILLLVSLPLAQGIARAVVPVASPVVAGKKITVTGTDKATAYVYIQPKAKVAAADKCETDASNFATNQTFALAGNGAQDLTLTSTLAEGDEVCVAIFDPAKLTTDFSAKKFVVATPPAPANPDPAFSGPVTAGSTLKLTGADKATLYIYTQPKAKVATTDNCKTTASGFANSQTSTISGTGVQTVTLTTPLQEGDHVCLATVSPAAPNPVFSSLATVAATPAPATDTPPSFAGKLIGGSDKITVLGQLPADKTKGPTISIYQFDAGYTPKKSASPACTADDVSTDGMLLSVADTTSSTRSYATLSGDAPPYNINLASKLVSNTRLCLVQTDTSTSPATVLYSDFGDVTDPLNYGRVRVDFTAGTVISNQQTTNQSSTAAAYLDLAFKFNNIRPGGTNIPDHLKGKPYHAGQPGLDAFMNLRLSSIPVSTSTKTVSTDATVTPSTSLNVLSSQQGALIFGGISFPWRLTHWNKSNDGFIVGPLVKSGFDTLLNPSLTSTTTTANATQVTSATFSSVYWFNAAGLRAGWSKFPASTDQAPETIAQFDMTIGHYSNLPSIICGKPNGTPTNTLPTATSCYKSDPTSATPYTTEATSRSLIPRVQLAGFIKLPNYPFLVGVDANLAQYAFGAHVNKVDTLNKPGNDVRIFFGVSVDPVSMIKKLNLPNQ